MARVVSSAFRASFTGSQSTDLPVLFVTVTHASYSAPIRLNSDNADYLYGGNLFTGVSLDVQIVSDDEQAPRAQLTMMNVDRVVSDALLPLSTAPLLKLELISSADFNTATPRSPLGSPSVLYTADQLRLNSITGDVLAVTGTLGSILDPTSEPWPGITGTQKRLPGLFR